MPRRWVDERGREHAVSEPAPGQLEPRFSRLLALQQSAGNAAVARRLQATRALVARQDDDSDVTSLTGAADAYMAEGDASVSDDVSSSEERGESPLAALTRAATERSAQTGNPLRGTATEHEAPQDEGTDSLAETGYQVEQQGEGEAESVTSISEDEPDEPEEGYKVVQQGDVEADSMTSMSEDEPATAPVNYKNKPTVYKNQAEIDAALGGKKTVYKNQAEIDAAAEDDSAPEVLAEPVAPRRRAGRGKRFLKAITKPFRAIGKGFAKLKKRKHKGVRAEDLLADDDFEPGAVVSGGSESSRSASASPATNYKNAGDIRASQSFSSTSEASANRAAPVKYGDLAKMATFHAGEQKGSTAFVNDLITGALAYDMKRFKLAAQSESDDAIIGDRARVRNALQKIWGWSAQDVANYYDQKTGKVAGTKVAYIRSAQDLKKYAVKLGSTLMQGEPPQPLDTSKMLSKASGPGFGIFVMDGAGNVFVGQHKVGLFHHSSFKAGGDVAAAGELKVTGGKLVEVTAKSGHYQPTPEQTRQVLRALADAGMPLAGVTCKVWLPAGAGLVTVVVDADEFLRVGSAAKKLAVQGMM